MAKFPNSQDGLCIGSTWKRMGWWIWWGGKTCNPQTSSTQLPRLQNIWKHDDWEKFRCVCVCAFFFFKIWLCLSLLWVSASLFVNTASYVCQRITFGNTINLDNVRWGRKKHKINDNNSQDKNNDSHEKHLERGKKNTSKYTSYLYLYLYLQTPQRTPKRLTAGIWKWWFQVRWKSPNLQGLVLWTPRTSQLPPKPAQSASPPPAAFHNRNGGYLIILGRVNG